MLRGSWWTCSEPGRWPLGGQCPSVAPSLGSANTAWGGGWSGQPGWRCWLCLSVARPVAHRSCGSQGTATFVGKISACSISLFPIKKRCRLIWLKKKKHDALGTEKSPLCSVWLCPRSVEWLCPLLLVSRGALQPFPGRTLKENSYCDENRSLGGDCPCTIQPWRTTTGCT